MSPQSPGLPLNVVGEKVSPGDAVWLVFDLETVLDPDMPPPDKRWVQTTDGPSMNWELEESFPSPPQCQIVAAGACALDTHYLPRQLILFGRGQKETGIVWDFSRYVKEAPGLGWVTFNGRAFDVPVLVARAMRHGRSFSTYFQSGEYDYRYAKLGPGAHVDLLERFSDFGAARRTSFLHYCRCIGLPGKIEEPGGVVDGSSVAAWYAAGEIERINAYCLFDVVQNVFLLQRLMLVSGVIEQPFYKKLVKKTLALFESTPILKPLFAGDVNRGKLLLEEA